MSLRLGAFVTGLGGSLGGLLWLVVSSSPELLGALTITDKLIVTRIAWLPEGALDPWILAFAVVAVMVIIYGFMKKLVRRVGGEE